MKQPAKVKAPGKYSVVRPDVPPKEFWREGALLLLSIITPIVVLATFRDADLFARSGSLMVFFAAVSEFVSVNRLHKKHVLNACRAKNNETPWDISPMGTITGWLAFLFGLLGTVIWGYGDKLFKVVLGI